MMEISILYSIPMTKLVNWKSCRMKASHIFVQNSTQFSILAPIFSFSLYISDCLLHCIFMSLFCFWICWTFILVPLISLSSELWGTYHTTFLQNRGYRHSPVAVWIYNLHFHFARYFSLLKSWMLLQRDIFQGLLTTIDCLISEFQSLSLQKFVLQTNYLLQSWLLLEKQKHGYWPLNFDCVLPWWTQSLSNDDLWLLNIHGATSVILLHYREVTCSYHFQLQGLSALYPMN